MPSSASVAHQVGREVASPSQEPLEFTRENLEAVGQKFAGLFRELGQHMIEREDALEAAALALLAKKHFLLLGHPGTAKTGLGELVLKNFVDEEGKPSVFEIKFQVETRRGEVQGPKLPGTGTNGKAELQHLKELGVGSRKLGMIDEVFDGPPAVVRGTLLDVLQGYLVDSGKREPIDMECTFAASNKTMEELRAKYGNELDAIFDRYAFIFWTTKRPLRENSGEKIMRADGLRQVRKERGGKPSGLQSEPIQFRELDLLRKAVEHVKVKMVREGWAIKLGTQFYRAFQEKMDIEEQELGGFGRSKLESQRTQNAMLQLLPAIAVLRHIRNPETPLAVIPDDFLNLKHYLMMRGPVEGDIPDEATLDATVGDNEDRKVLRRLRIENAAFDHVVREVLEPAKLELRRRTPANFSRLQEMIGIAESILANPAATVNELNDCIEAMPQTISDISVAVTQEPKGEEVLAKGVAIYLGLLKKIVEMSQGPKDVLKAKAHFRALKSYIDSLLNSFYRSSIEEQVKEFQRAIQEAYLRFSANASALSETMTVLDGVTQDEDILGKETIDTIRELVKEAALNHALRLGGASTTQDIEQACEELQKVIDLRKVLGDEGIEGKVPLEKVVEIHGKALERLKWILEAMKTVVPTGAGITEEVIRRMLDQVNSLLAQYKQGMDQDDLGARRGDQLPEDGLKQYLEFKKFEKGKSKKGATVSGKVEEKSDGQITIAWNYARTKGQSFKKAEWQQAYEAQCRDKILNNPESLVQAPQIKALLDRVLLLSEVAFGKTQWNEELKELIKNELLEAVIGVAQSGADGIFEWPIQPANKRITAIPIQADKINQAINARIRVVKQEEESIKDFLGTKSIQPTPNNLATFNDFLNSSVPAAQSASSRVSVETMETEAEQVAVSDVLKFLTEQKRTSWANTHGEIGSAVNALGEVIADRLVEDRLAALTASSGGAGSAIDVPSFVGKYSDFFSAGPTGGGQLSTLAPWEHLPINLGAQGNVGTILEADLTATLAALTAQQDDDLGTKLLTPLGELKRFLESLTGVNTDSLVRRVEQEKGQKVEQWVQARTQRYANMKQTISQMVQEEAGIETKISLLKQSIEGLLRDLNSEAQILMQSLEQPTDQERILSEGDQTLAALVMQAAEQIENLEMASTGFKINDVKSTLTPTNRGEVEDWMSQHTFFKTTEALIEFTKAYLATRPSATTLIQDIDKKQEALKKSKGEYLGKLQELAGSAI